MELQNGLQLLLTKYALPPDAVFIGSRTLSVRGQTVPIPGWRNERRFLELKNMVQDHTLGQLCAIRSSRIASRGSSSDRLLMQELDLCQWICGCRIESVMAQENGPALVVAVRMENGVSCTLELSATLPDGRKDIDRHELISRRGIASDRVVDSQIPQESVYLFSSEGSRSYTDTDFELPEYSPQDAAAIRMAFQAVKNPSLCDSLIRDFCQLDDLIQAVHLSAKSCTPVSLQTKGGHR